MAGIAPAATCVALTQDEVFKSINDNVGSPADLSKLIPWACGAIAVCIGVFAYTKWQKRLVIPRLVNHSGKLLREVLRHIPMRSGPVKQLKVLANEQGCSSPLTLLICPSLLIKATDRGGKPTNQAEMDRQALLQLARQMLAAHETKDAQDPKSSPGNS